MRCPYCVGSDGTRTCESCGEPREAVFLGGQGRSPEEVESTGRLIGDLGPTLAIITLVIGFILLLKYLPC